MTASRQVDQNKLRLTYHFENFNNLSKVNSRFNEHDAALLSNTACINIFCIENQYAASSYQFVDDIFNSFVDIEFCVISMSPAAPHMALLNHFASVKTRSSFPHA